MSSKSYDLTHVDEMLTTREARVLTWSLGARLAFFILFIILLLLHLFGLLRSGIVAGTFAGAIVSLTVLSISVGLITYGLLQARRQQHLRAVGLSAVLLDLLIITILPFNWYYTINIPDGSPVFLMKNELFTITIAVIVINCMALRPLYPAIMAAGAIIIHLVIMQIVLADSRVAVTDDFITHFYTPAVNPGIFMVRLLVLFIVGGLLSFLAWFARRNVKDAVDLEMANFEIKEQQAQVIHEGKMATLSGLVAGITHEINNPLGVVKSGLETTERSAEKLAEGLSSPPDTKTERMLQVMKNNSHSTRQAVDRIANLVGSLKDFAQLDESDVQLVDLHDGLNTTLSLIEPEKKGQVSIIKDYGDLPQIICRPKELNQVFMTLIVNAFEAMDGQGTLHVTTRTDDGHIVVKIDDTGPGIPVEDMSNLFEIGFTTSKGRVSMGLGLPMAQRIVKRHDGELSVHSTMGEGTSFTISLPLRTHRNRLKTD
jgi:signal transduction histidine kinase